MTNKKKRTRKNRNLKNGVKDRKGMKLDFDDIQHYQKIIIALTETDRIMKEIDEVIAL